MYLVKEGDEIIVKDSSEVVIPRNMQDEMLTKLHSTHLSERGMKGITRGKIWWFNMSNNIKQQLNMILL